VLKLARQICPDLELHASTQTKHHQRGRRRVRTVGKGPARDVGFVNCHWRKWAAIYAKPKPISKSSVHGAYAWPTPANAFRPKHGADEAPKSGSMPQSLRLPYEMLVTGN